MSIVLVVVLLNLEFHFQYSWKIPARTSVNSFRNNKKRNNPFKPSRLLPDFISSHEIRKKNANTLNPINVINKINLWVCPYSTWKQSLHRKSSTMECFYF